ncbi:hypothetical protein ACH4TQ_46840 [Streptomyces sp. NPDC021218]|uniref:hypothetical protein n=1 Tax=Streptomyces sp. NPDC021218 TaxID=3365119 RepID=UPI0037A88642
MSETRRAPAIPPGDGHGEAIPDQVAHLYADLGTKNSEPATVEACRTDYVVGAAERAAFDARARRRAAEDRP